MPSNSTPECARFRNAYEQHFGAVTRWVRALGANDADAEDLTQEVFIVFKRKLESFDGENVRGFLYQICRRTTRDHRRSAWYRARRTARAPELSESVPSVRPSALSLLEEEERTREVQSLVAQLSEKRRHTFLLFALEGYSGAEIADIQKVPVKTVWTRLHHARKDFLRLFVAHGASANPSGALNSASA